VVAKKVPPEAYFPFVDAWIEAHPDALVFVATDERSYHRRVTARYGEWRASGEPAGRVVSAARGYESRNVIADASRGSGHSKGVDVLLDALLLSKCDFLLKSASAVAEFAIWASLRLHAAHIDLQWEDRFRSQQPLPDWAASVARNEAQPFCAALARGCRIDARGSGGGGVLPRLLQGGQACSRCQPRLDRSSEAAAKHAAPMGSGDGLKAGAGAAGAAAGATGAAAPTCASLGGLPARRGLTQAECIAYARHHRLEFIGAQSEKGEFAGCVVWNRRTVEFNDHSQGTGCNIESKGGQCICTET
jgi:hypothetical protein